MRVEDCCWDDLGDLGAELPRAEAAIAELERAAGAPGDPRELAALEERAHAELTQLTSWAECRLALDGTDGPAQSAAGAIDRLAARLRACRRALGASDRRDHRDGGWIARLEPAGPGSWSRLYFTLASSLEVAVDGETLGLAAASKRLQAEDRGLRERTFHAIRAAWRPHRPTLAAAIGALGAWGREVEGDLLAATLQRFRMQPATLDALLEALYARRTLGQRALGRLAEARGWSRFEPWDASAPPPNTPPLGFEEALTLTEAAFDRCSPEMGDGLRALIADHGIDARSGPRRRAGAFSAPFPRERRARVFVQWSGTLADARILGHELGHAFHYALVKDRGSLEIDVPLSLIETPSAFAELAVGEALSTHDDPQLAAAARWQDLLFGASMTLSMPARVELERRVCTSPAQLSADALDEAWAEAHQRWFEGAASAVPPGGWMRAHHFFSAETRFAHVAYVLGYLLALGLHQRRAAWGDAFAARLHGFIGDLAHASVEACARRHLEADLSDGAFFHEALDVLEGRLARLEHPEGP